MENGKYIGGVDPFEDEGGNSVGGDTFKITLSRKFFDGQDILTTADKSKVRIVGDIKESHTRWYHRWLNFLTFRKYFVRGYVYTCEIVKNNK